MIYKRSIVTSIIPFFNLFYHKQPYLYIYYVASFRIYKTLTAFVICLCISNYCNAQTAEELIKKGEKEAIMYDFKSAIFSFTKVLEINPTDTSVYFLRAKAKAWSDDLPGSMDDCNRILAINPNSCDALCYRATFKISMKDTLGAWRDIDSAYARYPRSARMYSSRAFVKARLENFQSAIEDYIIAIQMDPTYYGAYVEKGACEIHLKKFKEAIKDFKTAIKVNSEYATSHDWMSLAFLRMGNYVSALEQSDKAISMAPFCYEAYFNRASAELNQQFYRDATKDINVYIDKYPEKNISYMIRGSAKWQLGDKKEACEDFHKAESLGLVQEARVKIRKLCK